MWCKIKSCIVSLLLFISCLHAKPLNVSLTAESAILINADTGKVLFAKNALKPQYPASMTKVATGLYAIKFFSHLFDKRYRCSPEALRCVTEAEKSKGNYSKYPSYVLETDMSHMGLKVGEEMTFRDLLLGTMIVSADDASNVIAEIAGNGSIEQFMQGMTQYLASIGLKNTKLLNPHGLHHPELVTTAHDIALLKREAMNEPRYAEIIKMAKFERPHTNKQKAVTLHATNKLLLKTSQHYYPFVTGGKTGYHRRARHNLVSTAERDNRKLIAVVMHVDQRTNVFTESKKLYEAAFSEKKITTTLLTNGKQAFTRNIPGGATALATYTKEPLALSYYPSEEPKMRCQLVWDNAVAPIAQGAKVGYLQLLADGVQVKAVPLLAANDVEMTFICSLQTSCLQFMENPIAWVVLAVMALLLGYFLIRRK